MRVCRTSSCNWVLKRSKNFISELKLGAFRSLAHSSRRLLVMVSSLTRFIILSRCLSWTRTVAVWNAFASSWTAPATLGLSITGAGVGAAAVSAGDLGLGGAALTAFDGFS